jgi:hypothetical protein
MFRCVLVVYRNCHTALYSCTVHERRKKHISVNPDFGVRIKLIFSRATGLCFVDRARELRAVPHPAPVPSAVAALLALHRTSRRRRVLVNGPFERSLAPPADTGAAEWRPRALHVVWHDYVHVACAPSTITPPPAARSSPPRTHCPCPRPLPQTASQ